MEADKKAEVKKLAEERKLQTALQTIMDSLITQAGEQEFFKYYMHGEEASIKKDHYYIKDIDQLSIDQWYEYQVKGGALHLYPLSKKHLLENVERIAEAD